MKNVMKIAAIAALLISASAFAGGGGNSSTTTSTSEAGSNSGAAAGAENGTNYQGVTTINQTSRGVKQDKFVPDAIAPGLTTTLTETCMGSSSGGLSVSGFGVAGGTTWTDENCVRRLDARELAAQGAKGASLERMCEDPANRAAILRANKQFTNNFLCYADTEAGIAEAQTNAQEEIKAETAARNSDNNSFDEGFYDF